MPDGVDRVLRVQAASNRNAEAQAELYAGHRARLTDAILGLAGGRVALLGAGACLDVDLPALAARFQEIHLVDLDGSALARAHDRQPAEVQARLRRHAPVDLGGVLRHLDGWRRQPPTLAALDALVGPATDAILKRLPAPFDAVVSCCLLTQLSRAVTESLGPGAPATRDVRRRVIAIHLRTMATCLRPGGQALLATDLVSNETYPLDELAPDMDLGALAGRLVGEGNFFEGADPAVLSQLLRRDPVLAAAAGPARPLAPWLWRAGPERTFLVTALRFDRRPG